MILDAKEGGVVYKELIPEYLDEVRTVSEGKHSVVRLKILFYNVQFMAQDSWCSCYSHTRYVH